eukprot:1331988-Pleurochrysis_carterae.AAC.1
MGRQAGAISAWRAQPFKRCLQQGKAGFLRAVPVYAPANRVSLQVADCVEAICRSAGAFAELGWQGVRAVAASLGPHAHRP